MAVRVIETIGKRNGKEVEAWYRDKVLALTSFLIKKLDEEQVRVRGQEPLPDLEEAVR